MGYLTLLYIALTVLLLFYCYRAIFTAVLVSFVAVLVNSAIGMFVVMPLVGAGYLKVFSSGVFEELLRTLALHRLGIASNIQLAIVTGLIFAGVENWSNLSVFLGPHLTAYLNSASVVAFYDQTGSSVQFLLAVSIEPFLRLLTHILLVFTGLEALSSRRYGIWAGVVLLHGMLNISIAYTVGIERIPLAALVIAVTAGILLLAVYLKIPKERLLSAGSNPLPEDPRPNTHQG